MAEPSGTASSLQTPRQRRLRDVTLVLLLFIVSMLAIAHYHPFFHPPTPPSMTPQVRKALATQYLFVLGFYSAIFALAFSMLLVAWLYIRDIRSQLAVARLSLWRKMADDQAESRRARQKKTQGDAHANGGDRV